MSAKVITKLRCYSPSLKNTPKGNVKHLYYIADRTNAMRNEYGSSIFGYKDYKSLSTNVEKKEIAKYIRKISETKNNVYRGIISLREDDAIRLGYTERESWETLMRSSIKEIAKVVDVPFSRLEYIGVVHFKKGNPHLHYMFWDKCQGINSYFITENQQNKIRDIVTKEIYKEELKELYNQKDEIKKQISSKDLINCMKVRNLELCDEKIPYLKMKPKNKKEIIKMFKNLCKKLPKKGSLKYAYMSEEIKQDLNNLVDKIINSNFDMKSSYNNYMKKTKEIADYFSNEKRDKIISAETNKMYKMLGNKLLNLMKEYKEISTETIVFNLFKTISKLENQQEARTNSQEYINSLSDNAKKEYARLVNYSSEEMETEL